MTETEWLACDDPSLLYDFLLQSRPDKQTRIDDRKLGLLCVACCRRIWNLLVDTRDRVAVEQFERDIDGSAEMAYVEEANLEVDVTIESLPQHYTRNPTNKAAALLLAGDAVYFMVEELRITFTGARVSFRSAACAVAYWRLSPDAPHSPLDINGDGVDDSIPAPELPPDELRTQAQLIRDIFGNPFRTVAVDPAWKTPTAVGIAQAIYDERAFDRLPILADALQDAGCEDGDILAHCRGGGPHVRGCWVVDLVLGKQ